MKFGYFTLSDNHYADNTRSPNQLVADIIDEALYAETLGMHSAWIGEHHFGTLGVLSCPDLALAYIAARTQRIRLAPAVTVLPLHHPIRVAEQWASLDLLSGGRVDFAAGRGYDRNEYPLSACRSTTTSRSSRRAWRSCAGCGRRRRQSRIVAGTMRSTTSPSRLGPCNSQSPPMSHHSPSLRSSSRHGWDAA